MFKRKHEFKPDKPQTGLLNKLYITKKQRSLIVKWLLTALALVVLSVIQDVILSRVVIFGGSVNLVPAVLLLITVLLDPEDGCLFILVASALYYLSGSAPGPYVIALLTFPGVMMSIIRQCYFYDRFGPVWLCAGIADLLYEAAIFAIGCFLGHTTLSRYTDMLICSAVSFVVMPLFYPLFKSVRKIGGTKWNDAHAQ